MIESLPAGPRTRCYVCAAPPVEVRGGVCSFCGARLRDGASQATAAGELAEALATGRFPAPGERDWFVDTYTARISATGAGLWLDAPGFVAGHDGERPRGALVPFATAPRTVGLVALARPDDPALPGFVAANRARFDAVTLVLDGPGTVEGATIVNRSLAGDFAAQRNAGMAASGTDWAFHLDLDETVEDALAAILPHLAARAEAAGLRAVGLPRRNHVDGALSDHHPDVQYRLLHRDERFRGRVHERPLACADWPRTTIAMSGPIDHHLARARIAERHALYETMGQDGERGSDAAALLRPFAP